MATSHAPVEVRAARQEDGKVLLRLVDALADYEKLARPAAEAKERLLQDIFGERPRLRALLAWSGEQATGYAFLCETYSSFLALPTLYLEDLFILEEFRGIGAGKALFLQVARMARDGGYGRLEWTVLDWNEMAKGFYRRFSARHMKEWELYRLTREDLGQILG